MTNELKLHELLSPESLERLSFTTPSENTTIEFDKEVSNVIRKLSLSLNSILFYRKDIIIAGWRRGYTAEAVARKLICTAFKELPTAVSTDYSLKAHHAVEVVFELNNHGWGTPYGYVPSLIELCFPYTTQAKINERAIIRYEESMNVVTETTNNAQMTQPDPIPFGIRMDGVNTVFHEGEVRIIEDFQQVVSVEVAGYFKSRLSGSVHDDITYIPNINLADNADSL